MNITLLDSSTLSRGDIDFAPFQAFGPFTHFDQTLPADVLARCQGAQVVITNKVVLNSKTLGALPALKLILISATGVNVVDLDAAKERGIPVCNVAGYSTPSVAQHVAALLLTLATNVHRFAAELDQWPQSPIFTRLDHPVTELAGKTCGIVGLGAIGSAFAAIAESLGMSVQVFAREESGNKQRPFLTRLSAGEFFRTSDVVSLHCPLTADNEHMINRDTLALMKPSAFLLNASRGPLIDEEALADALRHDRIAGAGLDVLSVEPPPTNHPLLASDLREKNLIITPHSAWLSLESRQRLLQGLLSNLQNFIAGKPSNRVA
ncbi:MAG: D-2-hydroxyacid dehydrogenase [Roseibacillus sp.]|nr:D-2-hydroxyacid dehydrogenase [Roseibacillus sp.]